MLANNDPALLAKLEAFRQEQTDAVAETVAGIHAVRPLILTFEPVFAASPIT